MGKKRRDNRASRGATLAVPAPPPAPAQPAYATPAAATQGDAIAIPAMGGALTSTHVCMITVAAQLLVVFAIQPNGEKGGNHVSVPVWAVLLELGIISAAILQIYRWLRPPPPAPARPPPPAAGTAIAAAGAAPAAARRAASSAAEMDAVQGLLTQRLLETGSFNMEQVEKVLPHLLPLLQGTTAETRESQIALVVRDVEDEMLRQGAQVGFTHIITLLNLAVYFGKLAIAVTRLFIGDWAWKGQVRARDHRRDACAHGGSGRPRSGDGGVWCAGRQLLASDLDRGGRQRP